MTLPLPLSSTPAKLAARSSRPDAAKVMIVFVLIVVTLYFGREILIPVVI
jgi:hypothetical protein